MPPSPLNAACGSAAICLTIQAPTVPATTAPINPTPNGEATNPPSQPNAVNAVLPRLNTLAIVSNKLPPPVSSPGITSAVPLSTFKLFFKSSMDFKSLACLLPASI